MDPEEDDVFPETESDVEDFPLEEDMWGGGPGKGEGGDWSNQD